MKVEGTPGLTGWRADGQEINRQAGIIGYSNAFV